MYGRSFQDPDGHHWEVFWMDLDAVEQHGSASDAAAGVAVTRTAGAWLKPGSAGGAGARLRAGRARAGCLASAGHPPAR